MLIGAVLAWMPTLLLAAHPSPVVERQVAGPTYRNIHELKDSRAWPPEPAAPTAALDAGRFDAAVSELCGRAGTTLGPLIRQAAGDGEADPFLLAALAYQQTRCRADHHSAAGEGLLQIQPRMYAAAVDLPVSREELAAARLRDPAHSLRVGALLLKMWETKHPTLDQTFASAGHRTGIAHFIWGENVRGAVAEDRTLTARRRLLAIYDEAPPVPQMSAVGISLVSPLAGAPRLATSGLGEDRDGGRRSHRGLDIDANIGEPVRAVADGVVQFAGIDKPGRIPARALTPHALRRHPPRGPMGPGGIFVRVMHANGIRTGYFHLVSYSVMAGQEVKAGEIIGVVGRSGVKSSEPHLHFEVEQQGEVVNPAFVLGETVIPPEATLGHDHAVASKQSRLAHERRARRRAWKQARHQLS